MPPELSVRELVALYAGFYPAPRPVDETIDLVGLGEQADARGSALRRAGRRLEVALALIGDPELIFLDEPTTGFDPSARQHAWEVIANLSAIGKTIFLTTHYMDEAQRLADRVAVIAAGEIVAEGTPATLGGRDPRALRSRSRSPPVPIESLPPRPAAAATLVDGRAQLQIDELASTLQELSAWALARGDELADLSVGRPTLEDVYLALTESDREQVS